jgi:hypothetical protein
MIAFIDDHRDAYGSSRSAVACRLFHPRSTSAPRSDRIYHASRRRHGRMRLQFRDRRQTHRGGLIYHGSRRSCQMFIEYAERLVKAAVATSRQLKPKINIMPPRTTSMSRYDSQPNASGRAGRSKAAAGPAARAIPPGQTCSTTSSDPTIQRASIRFRTTSDIWTSSRQQLRSMAEPGRFKIWIARRLRRRAGRFTLADPQWCAR